MKVCHCGKSFANRGRECSSCRGRKWYVSNRERAAEYRRNYYREHRAEIREKDRLRRKSVTERCIVWGRRKSRALRLLEERLQLCPLAKRYDWKP